MSNPSASTPDWDRIAADPGFHALLRAKRRFIVPATIFFLLYYMALPVAVGWFPAEMKKPVWGAVNVAYAFALSQFLMTFVLAAIYIGQARKWDRMEHELLAKLGYAH
jgi:uncharacterized membrane protein (DUF485 family)